MYTKEVTVNAFSMVTAKVFYNNKLCGHKFFSSMISTNKSVERRLKKAHKWCDERIEICKRLESR